MADEERTLRNLLDSEHKAAGFEQEQLKAEENATNFLWQQCAKIQQVIDKRLNKWLRKHRYVQLNTYIRVFIIQKRFS